MNILINEMETSSKIKEETIMMTNYRVVFDWAGYGVLFDSKEYFEEAMSGLYVKTYNQFVEAVNPNFDTWNLETEALGYEGSDDPESEYMQYIQRKQNSVLKDELNKGSFMEVKKNEPIGAGYEWYVDEYGRFHMSLIGDLLGLGYVDVTIHVEKM